MLLKSELKGWTVRYGTGETIGKVRDLIVNTEKPHWPVTRILVARGWSGREHLLDVPTSRLEIDPEERVLVRRGHTELREERKSASSRDHLRLALLDKAKVYSADDQLVGRAYDFAIATSPPEGWLVWRFLVDVPGRRTRRLRTHVADIDSVEKGRIVLKASKDEVASAT